MTVRVFISHSSENTATTGPLLFAANLREHLRAGLLAMGYEVLVDQDNILVGEHWRQAINGWVGACDVAIPILSRKAFDSPWVAYEASVLTFRAAMQDGLLLFPVFLDDPDAWPMSMPTQIKEYQGCSAFWDPEWGNNVQQSCAKLHEITAAVVTSLQAHRTPTGRPIDSIAAQLALRLTGIDPSFLQQEADRLLIAAPGWLEDSELRHRLATRLLTLGLGHHRCREVLSSLAGEIRDRDRLHDIIKAMASSWVDEAAVHALDEVLAHRRAVASAAKHAHIARFYVWRRAPKAKQQPSTCAFVCDVEWSSDKVDFEDRLVDLFARVRRSLLDTVKPSKVDLLASKLLAWANGNRRVFVALSRDGVTPEVMDRLRAESEFAAVGFFLLDCDAARGADEDLVQGAGIRYLEPRLQPDDEARYVAAYQDAVEAWSLL